MPDRPLHDDRSILTVPAILRDRAEQIGDKAAIVATDDDGSTRRLTYSDVEAMTRGVAASLLARGIERGDRVAIWAPNIWEWIIVAYGIQSVGAAVVPINTRYRGKESAYILAQSGARLLFTVNGFLGTNYVELLAEAGALADIVPALEAIVVVRGEAPDGTIAFADFLESGDAVSRDEIDRRESLIQPGDAADIGFTSGTTGNPKGVVATHRQWSEPFRAWVDVVGLESSDRLLAIAPFFHSFGSKAGFFVTLLAGATVYPQITFDPTEVLELIQAERITAIPGPPAIFQTILQREDRDQFDLSSLRLAVTGSGSVPVQLVVDMREVLGFDRVVTGYGLTEASGIATMCRFDDDPETIARTAGRALPGVEVIVAGPDGQPLPPGTEGEILVRGYNVMSGYWGDPEATAKTIVDGWLHTGDVGTLDDRGNLRITDRLKDMFIVGGMNVYPAEVEQTLLQHEAVREVAVIGVPDERLGEVGMAFVVANPPAPTEDELIQWTRTQLANFKVPRYVAFVDGLPRNASEKVLKNELRGQAAAFLSS